MPTDPVVMALQAALHASDAVELRVALGARLLELGLARDALLEFERGLGLDPAHPQALEGAVRAATGLGDTARAHAYQLARGAQESATPRVTSEPTRATRPARLRLVSEESATQAEPVITFADIGGLQEIKQHLQRAFLLPLQQPELFARFHKSLRGGLLLYGPPGCGKTFIARALAGELGARFISIGLSDVLDMWLGESERKLHALFDNARRHAPCVVFIDEIDALGQRRSQLKHSAGRNLVNQLLSELDGIGSRNQDLFVLGATNHPWDVDTALRRPGRFDRLLFVPAPDAEARRQILALKLRERPVQMGLALHDAAARTEGYSGADLQAVVDHATELAFEHTLASGVSRSIDAELLERALQDVKPSTRPWLETARNYAVYANEGGTYDELLTYLKARSLA